DRTGGRCKRIASQTRTDSRAVARDRSQRRRDRQSAEDFSVRARENGTDPDFLDQTDAEKIPEPTARGREVASERIGGSRSCRDAEEFASRLQSSEGRV